MRIRVINPLWPVVLALALSGCGSTTPKVEVEKAEAQDRARAQRLKNACSSNATYARLKQMVFDEAIQIRNDDPVNLDTLSTHSLARVENPVVKSRDETLDITVCSGRFILQVPPGAERAFAGRRQLAADIEYSGQAAADGSGLVYEIEGAETIIASLARFNLRSETARPAPAPAATRAEFADAPSPASMPPPAPLPAQTAAPVPARSASAPPQPSPPPVGAEQRQRAATAPSFHCRSGRSRSEQMVCRSERLSALDREMSSQFYSALSGGDGSQRAALRRTRDRFLAYREGCDDERCVEQAYLDRMDEIGDIASSR